MKPFQSIHGLLEELDSYLYQTVGQDAIEFVAQALEVPLYRRVIQGTAVEQGSEYGGRKADEAGGVTGDETEDLFQLLVAVKVHASYILSSAFDTTPTLESSSGR